MNDSAEIYFGEAAIRFRFVQCFSEKISTHPLRKSQLICGSIGRQCIMKQDLTAFSFNRQTV